MKKLLLILAVGVTASCAGRPEIHYMYDERGNKCFAYEGSQGADFDSMMPVDCTPEVRKAAEFDATRKYTQGD